MCFKILLFTLIYGKLSRPINTTGGFTLNDDIDSLLGGE